MYTLKSKGSSGDLWLVRVLSFLEWVYLEQMSDTLKGKGALKIKVSLNVCLVFFFFGSILPHDWWQWNGYRSIKKKVFRKPNVLHRTFNRFPEGQLKNSYGFYKVFFRKPSRVHIGVFISERIQSKTPFKKLRTLEEHQYTVSVPQWIYS